VKQKVDTIRKRGYAEAGYVDLGRPMGQKTFPDGIIYTCTYLGHTIVVLPSAAGSTSCDAMINSPPICISLWTVSRHLVHARPSAGKRRDGASRMLETVGIWDVSATRREEDLGTRGKEADSQPSCERDSNMATSPCLKHS
jgi:hypothetical protein